MSNPYEGFQNFIDQLPDVVQPLIVAALGMIPYVEGEGSAALGIIAGINPIVAAVAGAAGNILSVIAVVLVSSRIRQSVVARRAASADASSAQGTTLTLDHPHRSTAESSRDDLQDDGGKPTRRTKGRKRLNDWMHRFGVPGASLLAPLALPTQLTAAFFVASGVKKSWVILWQVVAIVLWTGLVAAAALGFISLLGW
ncbi:MULTISPECIES: small multidrug efflux protein [unclassified Arthrobacter]|uniref:small multidrug efflux protein n=1 Tax=unclassified Arthrobacter TaxID=235627 RepID=UPI001492C53E|nr:MULTISPECIES: small multidrug efflux protein [unclassified Arthrobacter]MBE0010058.1 small multidrug efflux protein [Arthrobacter sp. AET 35A]NOJ63937.1 small multidrug efflux protein [Arthrobacter sp. 147(2020)]